MYHFVYVLCAQLYTQKYPLTPPQTKTWLRTEYFYCNTTMSRVEEAIGSEQELTVGSESERKRKRDRCFSSRKLAAADFLNP